MIYLSKERLLYRYSKKPIRASSSYALYTREGGFLIFKKAFWPVTPLLVNYISSFRHTFYSPATTTTGVTRLLPCYPNKELKGCYPVTKAANGLTKVLPCYPPMAVGSLFIKLTNLSSRIYRAISSNRVTTNFKVTG